MRRRKHNTINTMSAAVINGRSVIYVIATMRSIKRIVIAQAANIKAGSDRVGKRIRHQAEIIEQAFGAAVPRVRTDCYR